MLPENPLATLRPGHARLILLDSDLPRIRQAIADHDTARRWHDQLVAQGRKLLEAPVTEFKIIGPRLLSQSRQVLSRVYTLGLLYRLDGDEAAGRRAVRELAAAAAWPHWNPSHFLDTAELNHAFGIGYDWLQPVLGDQREPIRTALIEKGLKVSLDGYRKNAWWSISNFNWNQVCNGGNSLGALAVADEEPELAREIVTFAVTRLPNAMHSYAPDGGWAEGPGYWHYATRYNVYALAGYETALGTDFGLSGAAGFDRAGDFRLHFVGPSGQVFNYADAGAYTEGAEEMFWLARRFDAPRYAWQERQRGEGNALDLIWFDPRGGAPDAEGVPLDAWFQGVNVVFLRGSWQDPDATWVGLKGGDNRANHSHLDLGSFVLDALGQRWVMELGTDNYNLPGYFGRQRWEYYRLNTQGQNTLVIDGQNQDTAARAPVIAWHTAPERSTAVVDLSKGYPVTQQVLRGVAMLNRRDVLLVDEVTAAAPVEVVWQAHTTAAVSGDGNRAVLEQKGKRFYAVLLAPEGAVWEARSAHQDPPQQTNDGIAKLVVKLPGKVTQTRIAMLFTPAEAARTPAVQPLAEWR